MLSNLLADVNQFLPTPSHGGRHTDISSPCAFRDFYPRPHMEGDLSLSNISLITLKFLPTPSHGGRPAGQNGGVLSPYISTHALTWRATRCCFWPPAPENNFYPRPHMEGDRINGEVQQPVPDFYPRPHMEGDRCIWCPGYGSYNFYPRPHMEGDPIRQGTQRGQPISTHALTWRATA